MTEAQEWKRPLGAVSLMLIFTVVGPLVGAAVVAPRLFFADGWSGFLKFLPIIVLGGYLVGGVPAIATGWVVSRFGQPANLLVHVVLCSLVGATASALWSLVTPGEWPSMVVSAAIGAVAALVCALLTRRWAA
jgi:hypothetical protein